jgi:glycosyltransferase involved in cell wall biosynthesis
MKVALIGRTSLHKVTGGDTIQMVKTANELKRLGVNTDIFLSSDIIDYSQYDLLHFFNLLRPADHLKHIKTSKKPYVVSTIYLDYTGFDRNGRSLPYRLIFKTLGKHGSEYAKNIYRFARGQDKLVSKEYLAGHKKAMQNILSGSRLILPNSDSEFKRITSDLGYNGKYAVIPNGIDEEIFRGIPININREYKVLCVAQVYGMKNQHSLILACKKMKLSLDIIGKPPPNHTRYNEYCRKIASDRVRFFGFMPQTELIKYYAGAKVHALPSWFETTGLTSLEAGVMGCNLVVGEGGDTKEYFREFAWYCDPSDQQSLENALEKALDHDTRTDLKELILTEYTWRKAAEKTKNAYELALNGQS